MKLPVRHQNHIIETKSFRILENWLPEHWIVRQVTERDYGIDAYIEIVNSNHQVTGNLISIQLKGSESLTSEAHEANEFKTSFSGIKVETANYWFNSLTPVFLIIVDVDQEIVFFAPVKKQLRLQYDKLKKQKTISFELTKKYSSLNENGIKSFLLEYFLEKENVRLSEHIRNLMIHWQYYLECLHGEMWRDSFLPVDEPEVFVHVFKTLRELASLLQLRWEAAELNEIFEYDKQMQDQYNILHAFTMDKFIPDIEKMFFKIFTKARDIVTNLEEQYWMSSEFLIWRKSLELFEVTYENRNKLY